MERMCIVDSMDGRELTPSRGWSVNIFHKHCVRFSLSMRSQEFVLIEGAAAVEGPQLSYGSVILKLNRRDSGQFQ